MLRVLLESRTLVALAFAAVVGTYGLRTNPLTAGDPFIDLIAVRRPDVLQVLAYGYAMLWVSTPLCLAAFVASLFAIVIYRKEPSISFRPLPPHPSPERNKEPAIVLGKTHHLERPGRSPRPTWLTIPQRGLYTGVMVVGAVGTGKSACMYPCVDQLLRWRADDEQRRIAGLVMEVKGDFCHQVKAMLDRVGRPNDYIEVGLERESATARCTTIWTRMPWLTPWPCC